MLYGKLQYTETRTDLHGKGMDDSALEVEGCSVRARNVRCSTTCRLLQQRQTWTSILLGQQDLVRYKYNPIVSEMPSAVFLSVLLQLLQVLQHDTQDIREGRGKDNITCS